MATRTAASSKTAWRAAGKTDRGPHTATFPSGAKLTFIIPDSGMLLRSGRLPENLRDTALLCAAHAGGADGYMNDLVMQAVISKGDVASTLRQAIEQGIDLSHILIEE